MHIVMLAKHAMEAMQNPTLCSKDKCVAADARAECLPFYTARYKVVSCLDCFRTAAYRSLYTVGASMHVFKKHYYWLFMMHATSNAASINMHT
jgi:hypothetical protein